MTRLESNTAKVQTPFGTFYVSVEHNSGRIAGVSVHHPQKFEHSEIGALLERTFASINSEIEDIARRWEGQ